MTKKAKKRVAKRVIKQSNINIERERVEYIFNSKNKSIDASFKSHRVNITAQQVRELIARRNDLKRFYAYCNADINLLSRLHADAQAKKIHECINTQYDSRKKLLRLVIQIALTSMKQKTKKIKAKAKA